jgi:hypothetical protein
MSTVRIRDLLVVCTTLGAIPAAHGQAPPTEPVAPAPGATAADGEVAAPREPAAVQAARKAKAAGQVIEAANDAAVQDCRDLGEADEFTATPGARGQLGIREALKATGRTRGASHVRYSSHVTLVESGAQREHGQFYDCAPPPLAAVSAAAPARVASEAAVPATAAAATATVTATGAGGGTAAPSGPSRPVVAALSGQLELVPVGTLHTNENMQPLEADISTAFGVSANVEAILPPYIAIGVNPGVVLGLKSGAAMASATQLDLRARMRVGHVAPEGFGEYGYVTAGGSWILEPNDGETSAGFSFGVGAGVTRRVDRLSFVTFEIGFQAGFQNATVRDTDVELSSRLFHVGIGFGRYLP